MSDSSTYDDLSALRETVELECKLAQGADGRGALPRDFWSTYSAFANANGGVVLLGVSERQGRFNVVGIPDVAKVRKELFDGLNNRSAVSKNLLRDDLVREIDVDGKSILRIEIPRARREHRPIFLTPNPFNGNTYRRMNESDQKLSDEEVKRLLAEQIEDSRDDRILKGYIFDDLELASFRNYRQIFATRDPLHPWNRLEDEQFLQSIGGWKRDRETGEGGLTVAGLLMFGRFTTIQEVYPNYILDYQERSEPKAENRWIDRITLDGKWSGNLFDFYFKVYPKLTADLKVPFQLSKGQRLDDSPVHVAIREALANVLVHADYSDRASVLVVKRPDMFGFRNPGLMRVPVEKALEGGESDCRNRTLHKMFRFIGIGEQAGTGIPKILFGWNAQHWSPPKLYETDQPYNQTLLELKMIDLFPEVVIHGLRDRFGSKYDSLGQVERVALALAASEGTVNHARLRAFTTEHPVDLTRTLQHLTQDGLLESTGGRGAVYHLPGITIPTPDDVFGVAHRISKLSSPNLTSTSPNLTSTSPNLTSTSPNLASTSPNLGESRDENGCLLSDQLAFPVVDDLSKMSLTFLNELEAVAFEPRSKGKINREVMTSVILEICEGRFVSLSCLAEILNRRPDTLREQYLSRLVRDRKLSLAFPTKPTHERQAYTSTESKK